MKKLTLFFVVILLAVLSVTWAAECDFDGDGKTDITAYYPAGGTWFIRGTSEGVSVVQWGWADAIPVPGDYDGDEKADIAVFHPTSGNWFISYSGGGMEVINWGWKDVWPIQSDYDGDGITDIAVYYPLQSMWFIRQSSAGAYITTWGWTDVFPTPWDYDHDGMTDIAFYNRAEMPFDHWHIRLSSGGTDVVSWGSISSIPVPANYLGDEGGIANMGIYRSLSSQWIVTGSTPATVWGTYRTTEPVSSGDYDGDGFDDKVAYNTDTGLWQIRYADKQHPDEEYSWGWSESTPVHLNYILLKLAGYSKDLF